MDIVWIGSPNKDKSREGLRPLAVVIHIMDGTLHGTENGNVHWYRGSNGEFFWAGATTGPVPG